MVTYEKIPAVSARAAKETAERFALADYGREYDANGERWYVLIYMR